MKYGSILEKYYFQKVKNVLWTWQPMAWRQAQIGVSSVTLRYRSIV